MVSLTNSLGIRIREVRSNLNISQEQLAIMANVSRTHMGRIERGDKSPTVDTVERIAKALSCPPSVLFTKD